MSGPHEKPAAVRGYASGFTHVNFTEAEMAHIQLACDELEKELGIAFNSSRQALVLLCVRYLRSRKVLP